MFRAEKNMFRPPGDVSLAEKIMYVRVSARSLSLSMWRPSSSFPALPQGFSSSASLGLSTSTVYCFSVVWRGFCSPSPTCCKGLVSPCFDPGPCTRPFKPPRWLWPLLPSLSTPRRTFPSVSWLMPPTPMWGPSCNTSSAVPLGPHSPSSPRS